MKSTNRVEIRFTSVEVVWTEKSGLKFSPLEIMQHLTDHRRLQSKIIGL